MLMRLYTLIIAQIVADLNTSRGASAILSMNPGIADEAAEHAARDQDSAIVGPKLLFDGLQQSLRRT